MNTLDVLIDVTFLFVTCSKAGISCAKNDYNRQGMLKG